MEMYDFLNSKDEIRTGTNGAFIFDGNLIALDPRGEYLNIRHVQLGFRSFIKFLKSVPNLVGDAGNQW